MIGFWLRRNRVIGSGVSGGGLLKDIFEVVCGD